MMGISLNPNKVANALIKSFSVGALGVNTNIIPREGEKCVSMQFTFENAKVWNVNLSQAFSPTLSQMRALYIDASSSSHDAAIFFPETGLTIPISAGFCQLVPLIEIRYGYIFYIYLKGQILDPFDTINVIATNVMLPPFNTKTFFGRPQQQILFQSPSIPLNTNSTYSLLTPGAGQFFINGKGYTFGQSNLSIVLIGVNSVNLFSMELVVGTTNPDGTLKTALVTHTVKSTRRILIQNEADLPHIVFDTYDYFFFSDVLNTHADFVLGFAPFALYARVLSGLDGSQNIGGSMSSVSWTYNYFYDNASGG